MARPGPIGRLHVTFHKIRKRGCRHVGVPFSDNMAGKEQESNGSTKESDEKSLERHLKTAIYCQNMPSN